MKRLVSCLLLCVTLHIHAQGYIVPNGVTNAGLTFYGYAINVIQNPTNGDYTGFGLKPVGKTPPATTYTNTFSFDVLLDEGVRVFVVPSNAPISLQPILSHTWTELLASASHVFTNNSPFYLGFYTGYNPWIITNGTSVYTGIYENPVFGWGRFVNNQGAIQLLDSALEIEGGGIYAGTQIIIPTPEPRSFALAGLGISLFWLWRRCSIFRRRKEALLCKRVGSNFGP